MKQTLKAWRANKNLTQTELSKLSGVSTVTISKVESGDCSITVETLKKLLSALEIDFADIILP